MFRRLLADTQAAAQGAVNASRAYANIIRYIDQADNASTSALDAVVEALNLVRSEILADCFRAYFAYAINKDLYHNPRQVFPEPFFKLQSSNVGERAKASLKRSRKMKKEALDTQTAIDKG